MNTTLKEHHPRIDSPSASNTVQFQTLGAWYCLVMMAALIVCGCASDHSMRASFADSDAYRLQLAVSDVQSFLYFEPATQAQVPQVRGSLRNRESDTDHG
jgi:hypothetical protein